MPDKYREQTSPLNVQRIGGVTMAENPVSTRPPLARKPHRYKVDEGLDVRFLCHANSTHVLQTLWRGLHIEGKKGKIFRLGSKIEYLYSRFLPSPSLSTRGFRAPRTSP